MSWSSWWQALPLTLCQGKKWVQKRLQHFLLHQIGFTEKTSFWPRLLVGYITANGWLATASHMLTYSFDQATFACPHFSTNQVEMITQETNPVYWACTHCLTLEPWTVIISTFILVVQFDNTIRFATLESVRPGLTAKGSFKNSKSKGRNLFIHHLCEIFHFIVKCVTGKCNMTAVI